MFRHTPGQIEDIATCVDIVGAHPVLGARYGPALGHLETAWRQLLHSDAFIFLVTKETASGFSRTLGAQVACFITDEFAAEIAKPPLKWLGPEIVNRVLSGPCPILTNAEVPVANSADSLNLMIWPPCFPTEYETNTELRQSSQELFFSMFRGFNFKRMQTQEIHPMTLSIAVNSGAGYLLGTDPQHSRELGNAESVVLQPHLIEVTRTMVSQQPGTWVSQFFSYRKPEIGFPRSEQRLLSAALHGGTNEELAEQLGISLSAVKKMWASVYLRIEYSGVAHLKFEPNENDDGDRGREKKQKLLAHLREHPEELRPYSMKLADRATR